MMTSRLAISSWAATARAARTSFPGRPTIIVCSSWATAASRPQTAWASTASKRNQALSPIVPENQKTNITTTSFRYSRPWQQRPQWQPTTPPHQQRRPYHFRPSQYDPDGSRLRDAQPLFTRSRLGRVARSPTTHGVALLAMAGAFIFYFSNLETVPVSGRTRFNVYSHKRVRQMSDMQFQMLLYDLERQGLRVLSDYDPRTVRVNKVMRKLIPFSGMVDEDWEIFVVDAPGVANALVLPGGKVFVFSGILPMARTDSALAAVLGHEIAHNVAGHVGERMSGSIGTNILLYSGMIIAGGIGMGPLLMHYIGSKLLGVAFENPMSRKQESEADYIGLMMMAEACYDPRDAVMFWQRMDQVAKEEVPEWASTHPSNENRIKKIQEWMPKALEKRELSDCHATTSFADLFRRALDHGIIVVEDY